MRVYVKEADGHKIDIKIPTGLVLNQLTVGIAAKACKKNGVEISNKQLLQLVKVAKDYKKGHPDWKLVEVESSDGEYVEIIL